VTAAAAFTAYVVGLVSGEYSGRKKHQVQHAYKPIG
jgi:hypothetical protein